jgi:ABC-type bacteriocin/lantibiotic exporter with double-glycine peptidase domain
MTPNNFFFTNNRLSIIYLSFGFLFLFGSAFWAKQTELLWMTIGASIFFFIISLFFIMKEYDKDYEQVKRL